MGEGEADSSVTHAAAARMLGVPSDLLEAAIEAGQVDTLGKQGAYYRMNPAGLPDAAGLVAAARDAYRLRLREVVAAAETLMAEVEAVQLDALEALENDTDPVRPLGPDIDGILTRGRGERGMTGSLDDLRSACLWATGAHRALMQVDADRQPPPAPRTRIFPPGAPRPSGHRRDARA